MGGFLYQRHKNAVFAMKEYVFSVHILNCPKRNSILRFLKIIHYTML